MFLQSEDEDEDRLDRLLEQAALEQLELEALKENAADLQAIDCEPTDKRNPLAHSDRARSIAFSSGSFREHADAVIKQDSIKQDSIKKKKKMTKSSPNDTPEFQSEECRRLIKNHCAAWTKKYTGKSKKKKPASTKAWRSVASAAGKKKPGTAPKTASRSVASAAGKKKPGTAPTTASRSVAPAAGKKKRAPASDLSQRSKKKARSSSDNQFEVARILDSRGRGTKREFFVAWRGFSADDSTWEPSSNILDPALIKEFENTRRRKRRKRS